MHFLILGSVVAMLSCLGTNFNFFESKVVETLTIFWNQMIKSKIILYVRKKKLM